MDRNIEEDVDVNIDDDWDGDAKRKHKSRKPVSVDEADGLDCSARKRTSGRHESRKRLGGSSKADSDQEDREGRKESRSKQAKKFSEDNNLDKSGAWYQDGESEKKFEGSEKSGSKGYIRAEEGERKKASSKYSEHGVSKEKVSEKDMRNPDRRDDGKEKGHRHAEHGRSSRKRHDDSYHVGKGDEYTEKSDTRIGNPSDSKVESAGARSDTLEYQSHETKSRGFESPNGKGVKSYDRDQRKGDSERSKRGRTESVVEDGKGSSARNDRSGKERSEDNTQLRNPTRDIIDGSGKSVAGDEDVGVPTRDKTMRDVESATSVTTPDKIVKRLYDSDNVEMDQGRSSGSFRRKEHGKDGSGNDRSKERDDRNRDQENSKETWKRKQDRESREGETTYENSRDWEILRRTRDTRDRIDADRPHGRVGPFGGRKDGNRTEAVKTSSKYGISTENYDVIEIQTKPFDYGRDDSRSINTMNIDVSQQSDSTTAAQVEELSNSRDGRSRSRHGSVQSGEDAKNRMDGDISMQDPPSWKDDNDFQAEKPRGSESNHGGQISGNGPLPPYGNQDSSSYRTAPPSGRGNKFGRVVRGRTPGREIQQAGMPLPFGPLGMAPPGQMQPMLPNMSPAPGPPISPGVFLPPFPPPMLWPGARSVDMNMLAIQQGLPPLPLGPRFPPNLGNPPNSSMFNPSGPVRGMPPNLSVPNFLTVVPTVRGPSQDKSSGGWVPPPRNNAPPGKAPSRGEQNDYSQNFVDTGMRPQNFIRELELTSVVEDYPKLRELIQRKDEIVANSATPPMYYKCDLREQALTPELFGTKFDVILVDPPWEEYVHRAPGVTDHMEHWTFEEIMNLKIEAIADTPSFIFLWVGDGVGLEQGRLCLKKWGFRRCEDICWVKTNKTTATPGLRHDSHTLYQRTKEHCLMGIKGTVRRSTDGHIIHANIDTDVIIAEEPPYGSTAKPEDMYRIVEHFALGRRRLELFGEDHNIRSGWLTVGKGLTSSNFNSEGYIRNFADKDGKVWQGGNGRNPPPEAPHLALTTPEIESLRPKSPMKNQQQMQQQQQSSVISLTTATSSNKRTTGNSPNHNGPMGPESNMPSPAPWASSPMIPDDRLDLYAYNTPFGPPGGNFMDYETHPGMNMF